MKVQERSGKLFQGVERHDVHNGVKLSFVFLGAGVLLLLCFWFLGSALGNLWTIEEQDQAIDAEVLAEENSQLRPPIDIAIQVRNASDGLQGLADGATQTLKNIGYAVDEPVNHEGEKLDESFVYYSADFKLEAVEVANILEITENRVRPMSEETTVETVDILVLLGQDAGS